MLQGLICDEQHISLHYLKTERNSLGRRQRLSLLDEKYSADIRVWLRSDPELGISLLLGPVFCSMSHLTNFNSF